MQKNKYKSEILKPKCVPIMVKTNNNFSERVEKYESLNTKKELNSNQKREKVILKDFINQEIQKYKKNPQAWILTNGPSGIVGKEVVKEKVTA